MGRFRGYGKSIRFRAILARGLVHACALFGALAPSFSVADNSLPSFLNAPQQFSCNGTPISRDANQTCSQPNKNVVQPVVCRGGVLYDQANAEWAKLRKKLSANAPMNVMPYKLVIPKRIIHPLNGQPYADGAEQAWVYVANDGPMKGQIVFYERADNYPPENPQYASADVFVDPSLNASGKVHDSVSGDSLGERFSVFDGRLGGLISGANGKNCDFFTKAQKLAASNRMDPVEKLVNAFTDPTTCKQNKFPCCGGGDGLQWDCAETAGTPVTQVSRQNLKDVNEVMKMTSQDFNLQLIYQLRKGLLNTQLELAKSMNPDDPAAKRLQFGPSSPESKAAAMQCEFPGESKNNRAKDVLQLAVDNQKKASDPRADEMRRQEEVTQNFQTIQDVMSAEVAMCAAKTQLGVDGKLTPEYRQIMDRNRMLGLTAYPSGFWKSTKQTFAGHDGVDDIYDSIRQQLVSRGWLTKEDLNDLENPYACRQSGNYVVDQVRKKLLSRADSYDVVMKSPITAKIRAARMSAFKDVQKRFDDLTQQCADADKPYSAGFLYDSGSVLWKNKPLVQAIARKYASENRTTELDRLHSIYCDNLDKKQTMDTVRNGVFVAATVAAIAVPPLFSVAGGTAATGAVIASTVGVVSSGLSIATATGSGIDAHTDLQNAVASYEAKFTNSKDLSETESKYHSVQRTRPAGRLPARESAPRVPDEAGPRTRGAGAHANTEVGPKRLDAHGAGRTTRADLQAGARDM